MLFSINKNKQDCDYIILDLETSSLDVKSCEIIEVGAVKVLDGKIIDTFSSLIRPRYKLDPNALKVNGISELELKKAKPDNIIIPEFFKFLGSHDIKGYNINGFDLPILKRYSFKFNSHLSNRIEDILDLAKNKLPFIANRKLSTVAAYFQIDTTYAHRALNDCEITFQIYRKLIELPDVVIEKQKRKFRQNYNIQTLQLNELKTVIEGVVADGKLDVVEIDFLQHWLSSHSELKGNYPYDRIYSALSDILEDGIIEECEANELLHLFQDFIDGKITVSLESEIDVSGKAFVLTGEFKHGERSSVIKLIEEKGGINKSGISSKIDLLIVGSLGSPDWSSRSYGQKIKRAKELQEKGCNILIISEEDFFINLI